MLITFSLAGQHNIIKPALARELAPSAGLRNILAHQYLEIDYVKLFSFIQLSLSKYPIYIQQITQFIDSFSPGE